MKYLYAITISVILLTLWQRPVSAQNDEFSFHWAFTYFCMKTINVNYAHNAEAYVITRQKHFNHFPKAAQKKEFKPAQKISYSDKTNIKNDDYVFIYVDGTIDFSDVVDLHKNLPKNIVFFIHRKIDDKKQELDVLKAILATRPGWAYWGDPYNPKTTIIRSQSKVFIKNNIQLSAEVPGGNK